MLSSPEKVIGDDKGNVMGLSCQRYDLGEPDHTGRRKPISREHGEFCLPVDTVIIAVGQGVNPLVLESTEGFEIGPGGYLITDEVGATTRPGVFAGGDVATGTDTVIKAMGGGKKAALAIHECLEMRRKGKRVGASGRCKA